ncbi:hypothetical protein P8A22_00065 [Streptomyces laculatispora]|uniref:Uncharacterized protein n=1 Tax=Streptomyces laculatispora TaxID=887464 RepID=A0ABY9HX19_9ACTN|nr:hypothetical protein [Streptomyces laculatispora]WLQ38594.1 hypothetical protein P8A22_00065 [Streptomyces laculatispora]
MTAPDHRAEMTIRFATWDQITGATAPPTAARPRPPPDLYTS